MRRNGPGEEGVSKGKWERGQWARSRQESEESAGGAEVSRLGPKQPGRQGFGFLPASWADWKRSRRLAVKPWSDGTGDGRKSGSELCHAPVPGSSWSLGAGRGGGGRAVLGRGWGGGEGCLRLRDLHRGGAESQGCKNSGCIFGECLGP